jgi:hypothetical protein
MTVAELYALAGDQSLLNYGNREPDKPRSQYRYQGDFIYRVTPYDGHPGEYLLTMGTGMYQDDWVTPVKADTVIEVTE